MFLFVYIIWLPTGWKGATVWKHTLKKIIGHSVHEKMTITCAAENGVGI